MGARSPGSAAERVAQAERLRSRPARGRLVAAARELVGNSDYERLTVGRLAERAGVSRETFYTHFADKQACLAEATALRLGDIDLQLRVAEAEGESWAGPILAAVERSLSERYSSEQGSRGRIIDAMVRLAATRGFAATRLVDVIKAARVSYPSFYRHFAGKPECFAVACAASIECLETEIEERGCPTPEARLRALAGLLAADSKTARLLIVEAGQLPAQSGEEGGANAHSFAELLGRLLGDEGLGRTPLIVGATLELLRWALLNDQLDELASDSTDLLGGLGLDQAPSAGSRRPSRPRRGERRGARSPTRLVSAAG